MLTLCSDRYISFAGSIMSPARSPGLRGGYGSIVRSSLKRIPKIPKSDESRVLSQISSHGLEGLAPKAKLETTELP